MISEISTLFQNKEKKSDKSFYGVVEELIVENGTVKGYKVSMGGASDTVDCRKFAGANVGDTVMCMLMANGSMVVTGRRDGDGDAAEANSKAISAYTKAETAEDAAEQALGYAESAQASAESAEISAAQAIADAAEAAESAAQAQASADQAIIDAASASTAAGQAQSQANAAAQAAQTAQASAEQAIEDAETASTAAAQAKNMAQNAQTAAQAAQTSAASANTAAQAAQTSATAANTAANNAGVAANIAQTAAEASLASDYKDYGTMSLSDTQIGTICQTGYSPVTGWARTTGYYAGAVAKGEILIIHVTETDHTGKVADLFVRADSDAAISTAVYGTVIAFVDRKAYFWHDQNGAHVLSENTRVDILDGMSIIDNDTAETMAIFDTDGAEIRSVDNTVIAKLGYGDAKLLDGTIGKAAYYTLGLRGVQATTIGEYSVCEGRGCDTPGPRSHAEGFGCSASEYCDHAEGNNAKASGGASHAEGYATNARGQYSHAEGYFTTARGEASHAEGYQSMVGNNSGQVGNYGHAEGLNTRANGVASHAEGSGTVAASAYQHVEGTFNSTESETTFAHVIGNGTSETPSNAFGVDWDGNVYVPGSIYLDCDDDLDNGTELDDYLDGYLADYLTDYMADYVIEAGDTGAWHYRKWASGDLECWGRVASSIVSKTPYQNFILIYGLVTFPFTFINVPNVVYTVERPTSNFCFSGGTATNTNEFNWYAMVSTTAVSAASATINVHVRGKWK